MASNQLTSWSLKTHLFNLIDTLEHFFQDVQRILQKVNAAAIFSKIESSRAPYNMYKSCLSCLFQRFFFFLPWYFLVLQNLLALPPKHLEIQEGLSFECSNCHNLFFLLVKTVTDYWSHST